MHPKLEKAIWKSRQMFDIEYLDNIDLVLDYWGTWWGYRWCWISATATDLIPNRWNLAPSNNRPPAYLLYTSRLVCEIDRVSSSNSSSSSCQTWKYLTGHFVRLIEVLCEDQITFSKDQIPKWVKNGLTREMKFRGVVTPLYSKPKQPLLAARPVSAAQFSLFVLFFRPASCCSR